ncbi:MAG: bifunctional diaminohydroxyphosphoribosylaminopyrimidine deaminase/5-amino-6-(5-phosphoribosylamino)uracil reductase RibD [Rhodoferax sp.]
MLGPLNPLHLSAALVLAHKALLLTSPNPRVGCVLTSGNGEVIGQGHTQRAGQAHAEVMALRDAAARGHSTVGATAYVTLEPCSHQGRTGPCCDALIAAGVARVVVALGDPNPLVAGQGMERLRRAGVEVELLPVDHPVAIGSRELNIGFFSRMLRQRPWVRMKVATSLDGFTALPDGRSQWITGEAARADGHAWRARACAILTGIGTVLHDRPLLDVRHADTPRQPHLVVVDSLLRTPLDARFLPANATHVQRKVWIYAPQSDDAGVHARAQALVQAGAEVRFLPAGAATFPAADPLPRVDLAALLRDLAQRGEANELHVEAGHTLNTALWNAGLVDELLWYQAPMLLGQGLPAVTVGPVPGLDAAPRLDLLGCERVGEDMRLLLRKKGAADF